MKINVTKTSSETMVWYKEAGKGATVVNVRHDHFKGYYTTFLGKEITGFQTSAKAVTDARRQLKAHKGGK